MPPSTAHPEALPDPPALRRLTQSLAILDAIIHPEWGGRSHSFNSRWKEGAQMASMRNGGGDEWFLLFDAQGAALKGFAHETPLNKQGAVTARIRASMPPEFAGFLGEPAFSLEDASFCLWRRPADAAWNVVPAGGDVSRPAEDGSAELLRILDGDPQTYQTWAEECYERAVSLNAIRAIYAHEPLTAELVAELNPNLALADVAADDDEIGYGR